MELQPLDSLRQVAEFHHTFRHPVLPEPQIPSEERCQLRVSLLAEELDELRDAIEQNDLLGIADALCDLQYVLSGAVLEFGLGPKFRELFDEVQRSNMSKTCHSLQEAEATQQFYLERDGTRSYIRQEGTLFLVYREGDHKTLKSVNYSPPNLQSILQA
jgi:predicted HAD superfamily Cof-like phosphohydrolase